MKRLVVALGMMVSTLVGANIAHAAAADGCQLHETISVESEADYEALERNAAACASEILDPTARPNLAETFEKMQYVLAWYAVTHGERINVNPVIPGVFVGLDNEEMFTIAVQLYMASWARGQILNPDATPDELNGQAIEDLAAALPGYIRSAHAVGIKVDKSLARRARKLAQPKHFNEAAVAFQLRLRMSEGPALAGPVGNGGESNQPAPPDRF